MNDKKSFLSEDFPEKLKHLRKNRGWSQGQLAKKIGADPNRISRYERGVIWPTLELIVRIAAAFEVSLDYLLRNEKGMIVNKISNQDLLKRVETINQLPEDDQKILIAVLDAFIKKWSFARVAQGRLIPAAEDNR